MQNKGKAKHSSKKITLHPIPVEEALADVLKVPPPPEKKRRSAARKDEHDTRSG